MEIIYHNKYYNNEEIEEVKSNSEKADKYF
jgi:hypothetical protein